MRGGSQRAGRFGCRICGNPGSFHTVGFWGSTEVDDQLGNDFVNGLDSALAAVMRKINTTSGVKTADGEQLYYAPTDSVKLVSVVIEGMSGSADASYRIK